MSELNRLILSVIRHRSVEKLLAIFAHQGMRLTGGGARSPHHDHQPQDHHKNVYEDFKKSPRIFLDFFTKQEKNLPKCQTLVIGFSYDR